MCTYLYMVVYVNKRIHHVIYTILYVYIYRAESLNRLKLVLGQSDILFSKFCRYCCSQARLSHTTTTSTTSFSTSTPPVLAGVPTWGSTIIEVVKSHGPKDPVSNSYTSLILSHVIITLI